MAVAHRKLELSRLKQTSRELMGQDYDPEEIKLTMKGVVGIDLQEAIVDATVERTIEGASTFTISVVDHDRLLLRSGRLAARTDVKVDGLWFRLVSVNKNGDMLDLVFEDREIAILRTYNGKIKASGKTARYNMTRARFILRLINEVKEFKIPWVIPELDTIQVIETGGGAPAPTFTLRDVSVPRGGHGIPHGAGHRTVYRPSAGAGEPHAQKKVVWLTSWHTPLDNYQIDNCNKVLDTGESMRVSRPLLVMSIMCGMQEANLRNPPQLNDNISGDSAGFFQERPFNAPTPADRRNVPHAAKRFFTRLMAVHHQHPNWSYTQQIQEVQRSAYPDAYQKHKPEAEKIVTAYLGGSPGDNQQGGQDRPPEVDYRFYRGKPKTISGVTYWDKETSWACIQRLAQEVNWRAFFISGTFYYMSEDQLFKAAPVARISENSKGIEVIDGEYDIGKNSSEVTVQCHMGRWKAPPGSTIQIIDTGPFNGVWLVSHVRRSLYNDLGEITLKKPSPRLPEPIGDTMDPSPITGNNRSVDGGPREPHETPGFGPQVLDTSGAAWAYPLARKCSNNASGVGGVSDHMSRPLHNWPSDNAWDMLVPIGTKVIATHDGKIREGKVDYRPLDGGQFSGGSFYLDLPDGRSMWFKHLKKVYVHGGQKVRAGQVCGLSGEGNNVAHLHFATGHTGSYDTSNRWGDPVKLFQNVRVAR